MKTTHHTGRAIGETTGRFRWCRVRTSAHCVQYRLYQRSEVTGAWEAAFLRYQLDEPRSLIARELRAAVHALRAEVLAADLAALDSASAAA